MVETNPGNAEKVDNGGGGSKVFFFHTCVIDILLGATYKDDNEGLFHVAFAIVNNDTDEN